MRWILITESYPQTMLVCQCMLPQGQPLGRMTSYILLHGGHVRLGVIFMYWSNFLCVGVTVSWIDFITLSYIIRICGHVMDAVITLWWPRESWYVFSPSWLKSSSRFDFVRLGVILCLGAIKLILVWLFSVFVEIFVLVSLCRGVILCFGAINWILLWFFFVLLNYFVLVWFCLIWYHTISWYN